jgi:AcrR family transcriptional regulator
MFANIRAMSADLQQLPRGRHGLSREEVLASQRSRILGAVAAAVAEKGFARVTVADVIGRAGVSRETFYEQFSDKEDCYLAALDAAAAALLEILSAALEAPARDPIEQLDHVLQAYLGAVAAEPAVAKAYLIDAFGAGPAATRRRIELQQQFVELMVDVLGPEERFMCETIVAAVSSMVTMRVGSGRSGELQELREPLIELVRR